MDKNRFIDLVADYSSPKYKDKFDWLYDDNSGRRVVITPTYGFWGKLSGITFELEGSPPKIEIVVRGMNGDDSMSNGWVILSNVDSRHFSAARLFSKRHNRLQLLVSALIEEAQVSYTERR